MNANPAQEPGRIRRIGAQTTELGAAIVGSFRRGLAELRADHAELRRIGCRILSPVDTEFDREEDGFVFAASDGVRSPEEVEEAHLAAVRAADFIWLHAPEGYIGPSGAFELGVATLCGIPVLTRHEPRDIALQAYVRKVASPTDGLSRLRATPNLEPAVSVRLLQSHYRRAAVARGWGDETPVEAILLLTEEIGELARAVRKRAGLARRSTGVSNAAEELADVQLYVVHLANLLEVDLADAVARKEQENTRRYEASVG